MDGGLLGETPAKGGKPSAAVCRQASLSEIRRVRFWATPLPASRTAAIHPRTNPPTAVGNLNPSTTALQPPHSRAAPVGRQHTRANRGTGSRLPTGAAVRLPSIGEARGYAPSRRPRPSAFRNPQRLSTHQPSKSITASTATQPQRQKAGGPKPARRGRLLSVKRWRLSPSPATRFSIRRRHCASP